MNAALPPSGLRRRLLPFVVAAVLAAGALGAGGSPAVAENAPESLDVSGVVVVIPDETGVRAAATGTGGATVDGVEGGVWIASAEGSLLPIDEQTLDSGAEELRSGAGFEGTVELPPAVADAVAEAEVEAEVPSEPELMELVADAAVESGVALAVQEAEILPPVAGASAVTPHQADVVFLSRSVGQSLPAPNETQMRSLLSTVSSFWATQSDGRVPSIAADRVTSVPTSTDVCNQSAAWEEAVDELGTDFESYLDPDAGKHLVVLVNDTKCALGLGTLGDQLSGGLVWVNLSGRAIAESAQTLAHEVGHNFGLMHANARVCDTDHVDAPYGAGDQVSDPCADIEYGDLWSAMGISVIGHTSVPLPISLIQREYLGTVPDGAMRSVSATEGESQSFTLSALGSGSGLRGLRVEPDGADPFVVEYRNGVSPDPALPNGSTISIGGVPLRANPGVKVTKSQLPGAYGSGSIVLTRKSSSGVADETLRLGDSLAPLGGATVTVTGLSQTEATVLVEFGPSTALIAGTPVISGAAKVGVTLTVDPGAWDPVPESFDYQWKRDGTAIAQAIGSSYRLTTADAGKTITVTVTGHLSDYASSTAASAATAKVGKAFTTVPTPTISGTVKVGATLTAKAGTWKPTGASFGYQWLRNGEAIPGATKSTYKLVRADGGTQISVRVKAKKSGYYSESKASAMKTVPSVLTVVTPKISGTVKVGKTLTAKPGAWTEGTKFSYQWKRNGAAIKGATKSTYKPKSGDATKKITVTVTGKKSGFTTAAKTSAAVKVPRVLTAKTPALSGTVKVGSTLKVKMSAWKPKGVKFSYQWLRDGAAIPGSAAKKSSYKLVKADAGSRISVRVAGKKSGYASEVRTSAQKKVPLVITAVTPKISGTAKVTYTLTAVSGAWAPEGVALSYQWKRNGKSISGATKAAYKLKSADKGKKITVTVTGKKAGHATESRTSKATAAIKYPSRTSSVSDYNCPSWAPIKGNADSMIYHVPGGRYYKATKPEDCFTTSTAAKAAGYRASKV